MAKNLDVAILFDFYDKMLTDKQRNLIDLYYNEDLSLGEISQLEKITRQGVLDSIKRGETFLYELEEKLKLFEQYKEQQKTFNEILRLATEISKIGEGYQFKKLIQDADLLMKIAQENLIAE